MRILIIFMSLAAIVILEFVLSDFWNAIQQMFASTHPVVAFILFIIFLDIFVIAVKELKGLKEILKKTIKRQ